MVNSSFFAPLPSVLRRLCERLLPALVFIALLISCATSPKAGPEQGGGAPDFSFIPPGAEICLWADVQRSRPLLEVLSIADLGAKDASRILDLTDTAMAAFYPDGASRRFFLAGWGKYPKIRAGVSMGLSRDWKKKKSETGKRYWYSESHKLGVALGSALAFASDGDPFAASLPGLKSEEQSTPLGFEEFRRTKVLSLWLNDPKVLLDPFMDNLGIPIQIPAEDFYLGVGRLASDPAGDDQWELAFKIRTQSANQARSLLTLISMARLFIQRAPAGETAGGEFTVQDAAALLFANPPEQEGEFLTIRTGPVDLGRIALLFSMFSL